MQFALPLLLCFGIGYLFGSIPFGLILTRAAGLGDVRNIGSGNIGATNVLRTGHKGLAAATLVLDALKATAAIFLVIQIIGPKLLAIALPTGGATASPAVLAAVIELGRSFVWVTGLGAVLGHMFPIWLGFRGGKGVATYIGTLIGVDWRAALIFGAVWLAVAAIARISSAAALTATLVVLGYFVATGAHAFGTIVAAVLTILIFWTHRENLQRLLAGTESKIGSKSGSATR